VAQTVSLRVLTTEVLVRCLVSPFGIGCGQNRTGTGFSPSSSVSPVDIIPSGLRTHVSSVGRTIGLSVAAFQRHSLTPST
jgi:hypothetical protein